jgi:glycerol-3-phosphate dehydrogenase (NAD(P)+)
VVERAKPFCNLTIPWLTLSKGIEQTTLLLPTQIIDTIFENKIKRAVLTGPSFAKDVAEKKITAVTLAVDDYPFGLTLQKIFANDYFCVYRSSDCNGAQVAAALKNVIALVIGILDGAGFTDNTKAFILTLGLHEMVEICLALGGKKETVYELCGIGDLVLTCMGNLSKNLEIGRRFGKGQSLTTILQETGYIPEGINTLKSTSQLWEAKNLKPPLFSGIYQVIFNEKSIKKLLVELMCDTPPS